LFVVHTSIIPKNRPGVPERFSCFKSYIILFRYSP